MKPEMKETIAAAARAFQLPAYPDIPDVGLYLEQTVKYVNGYLEPLHGMELTASTRMPSIWNSSKNLQAEDTRKLFTWLEA